jgi:hypothetical protein
MFHLARRSSLAAVIVVAAGCVAGLDIEPLSDHWVIEHQPARGIHGRYTTYLARRDASGRRRVSNQLLETRYLGDDCVAFIDGQSAVHGVCGDLPPLFVGLLKEGVGTVQRESVIVEARQVTIPEIKLAAQEVWQERLGGRWIAQREAFSPPDYARIGIERFVLFRDDSDRGTYRASMPILGYRYLAEDCVLSAHAGVRIERQPDGALTGELNIAAQCGDRDRVFVGSIERLSDLFDSDELPIDGVVTPISELKARAMVAPMR